jgi:hypothetical protein
MLKLIRRVKGAVSVLAKPDIVIYQFTVTYLDNEDGE